MIIGAVGSGSVILDSNQPFSGALENPGGRSYSPARRFLLSLHHATAFVVGDVGFKESVDDAQIGDGRAFRGIAPRFNTAISTDANG
jgi:hypothetical protein